MSQTGRKHPQPARPEYRPDIDGLRAIAVLSVVGYHAFQDWIRGGFIGVDIFFVISGYLISSNIFDRLESGNFSCTEFYSRRIRRIFPALVVVLLASLAIGWFSLLPEEFKQLGKHVLGASGFVSNFVLWNEDGYFDNSAETKPLLHLWSLGIEEQFYILYPLLLWLGWKWRWNLLNLSAVIAVVSFGLNLVQYRLDSVADFYSPLTRFWELMVGSLLAYLTLYRPDALSSVEATLVRHSGRLAGSGTPEAARQLLRNGRSLLGMILIAAGLLLTTQEARFPGWWAVLPTFGTALVISGGMQARINSSLLAGRILVWFGLISYPLYLWHWILLAFPRILKGDAAPDTTRIAAVLTAVALAWLTYKLVEHPWRFGNYRNVKTMVLALCMAVTGYTGYICYRQDGFLHRTHIAALEKINAQFGPWAYYTNSNCRDSYPFPDAGHYRWWFCMQQSASAPTILLLGNSLANHLYPGVAGNSRLQHHNVLSIGTCDPVRARNRTPDGPCYESRYTRQRELIDGIIRDGSALRFVIIAGLDRTPDRSYIELLRQRLEYIESHGLQVIIFTPGIFTGYDPRSCFTRHPSDTPRDCSLSRENMEELHRGFRPLIDSISRSNPRVRFFDQAEVYCDERDCSLLHEGMPLHRDAKHFSVYGSQVLSEKFVTWAESNLPEILEAPAGADRRHAALASERQGGHPFPDPPAHPTRALRNVRDQGPSLQRCAGGPVSVTVRNTRSARRIRMVTRPSVAARPAAPGAVPSGLAG